MYLVVILVASLMSLAMVSYHICPIYCFQGLFHIRTFCMQRRWVIYDIFTCHGRSNHWWHFFPPILQPDSKYFIVPWFEAQTLGCRSEKASDFDSSPRPTTTWAWHMTPCAVVGIPTEDNCHRPSCNFPKIGPNFKSNWPAAVMQVFQYMHSVHFLNCGYFPKAEASC